MGCQTSKDVAAVALALQNKESFTATSIPQSSRSSSSCLGDIAMKVEARMGRLPYKGRYHTQRKIEDDFSMSQKVLGTGCNGEVRMATSKLQPRLKVAVKSLRLDNIENEHQEDLENELQIFLSMDHPHITRLYDVYESQKKLHLVMECMEGGEVFDRVREKNRFSEEDARDALRQMLLALNYMHSHGVVHRDIKLENFLYDKKGSSHLKLIDFGFSKMWNPNDDTKMTRDCGTLSFVAPEVLNCSYTSQCDLWSLGVIAFILLLGYMPFSGSHAFQIRKIKAGKYSVKPERWAAISGEADSLIRALMEVDPSKRLTAQQALEHPWICQNQTSRLAEVSIEVAEAFGQFSQASIFRRCCMKMLAWSLSNEESAKVRDMFLSLDTSLQGTLTLEELKSVMVEKLKVMDESEIFQIFEALDYNHDKEIDYSDFLAAMVNTQTNLNIDLLHITFRRFDVDGSGFITLPKLEDALGSCVDGHGVEALLDDIDQDKDGRISLFEFVAFLNGEKLKSKSRPRLNLPGVSRRQLVPPTAPTISREEPILVEVESISSSPVAVVHIPTPGAKAALKFLNRHLHLIPDAFKSDALVHIPTPGAKAALKSINRHFHLIPEACKSERLMLGTDSLCQLSFSPRPTMLTAYLFDRLKQIAPIHN